MKRDSQKVLLSILLSGSYLSRAKIVELGKAMGITLPFKRRELILQKLFIHVKANSLEKEFIASLSTHLNQVAKKYERLANLYPNSAHLLQMWIQKINTSKLLLQKEFFQGDIYG